MRDTKKSGSGIFLMEMIMVCGFFLLCAAVCVRAFVQADSLSRMARGGPGGPEPWRDVEGRADFRGRRALF